jgi:pimeloyl-ACP methyl ester carboxylesterase
MVIMYKKCEWRCSLKQILRLACLIVVWLGVLCCHAQERTLAQIKAEAQRRADHQVYPFIGMNPDDVREALSHISSLDPEEWASAWSAIGDRCQEKARSEEKQSPEQAGKEYVKAWLYYTMGRWPAPDTPGKEKAYQKAVAAYLDNGKLLDPPLQVARIPFEGKEAIAYIQMPKGVKRAPMVIGIGGLDSRKEDMAERLRPLLAYGIGYMALDPPGGGQAPVKAGPGAQNMLAAEVDYLFERPDVDPKRIAIYGASLGGYWSTLLAAMEGSRLCAVVSQSPPVDDTFSREHTMALPSNREYFFHFVEALEFMFNADSVEGLAAVRERMSLKNMGMLDRPMAPMLVIGGARDTQVPFADLALLLQTGQSPKEAWINPLGGHMGRDARWSDPRVFQEVATPWLVRMLKSESGN